MSPVPSGRSKTLTRAPGDGKSVGGARKGAGRKPQGEVAMVTTAFVIRQDQRDWLKQFGNRSEVVRAALDTKMKTTRKRKERS